MESHNYTRTVFIGSVRGSYFLKPFLKMFDNGTTKFVFTGNLFGGDGGYSFQVAEEIKKLYHKGEFYSVLGAEDFYFLMGIGAHPKATRNMLVKYAQADDLKEMYKEIWEENYSKFLELANGRSTLESFNKGYGENTDKEIEEMTDLLLYSLNMAHIDEITGSVVVSGGIPVTDKGVVISDVVNSTFSGKPRLTSGIDYVMSFNNELLVQNPHTFMKLTSFGKYQLYDMMDELVRFGQGIKHLRGLDDSFDTFNSLLLPMDFDNSRYERNPEIASALQRELNEYGSKRLICSGLRSCSDEQFPDMTNLKEKQGDFLIRLERSHIKAMGIRDGDIKTSNNFGYCIIEKGGKVKYIGDSIELFEEMYDKSYMDEI